MNEKISNIVLATLVADSYSLGAHWIYSQEELKHNNLNWQELNDPMAMWHKNKSKGEFTHYGDQTVCLYEYIKKEHKFEIEKFIKIWEEYMLHYEGYIDASSRETLENISKNQIPHLGATSHDLSIISRMPSLLFVSKNEEEFLTNVNAFVILTHNSDIVKESAEFFAKILWAVYEGKDIIKSIQSLKVTSSQRIKRYIENGLNCTLDTFDAIREFGPACGVEDGFSGVIYILNKYGKDFKNAMIQNAKAGGDSSARSMIIAMLLVASYGKEIIPLNWINQMKYKVIC